MTFIEAVISVLQKSGTPLSPSAIRDAIKSNHPEFYNTESHQKNITNGHYTSADHALLAQIYTTTNSDTFVRDKSAKPMLISLRDREENLSEAITEEPLSLESVEQDIGILYILKSNVFTNNGREIIKIGITSGETESRIKQLYTTGVPYRFVIYKEFKVFGFMELEKSLHALLGKFRVNPAREFFTDECLPYAERLIALHMEIYGEQH